MGKCRATPAHGWLPGAVVVAALLWLGLFAAFGLPGHSLDWGRDLLVFFGQINALEHGQVPYRDFRTSMGALPFYLPWAGFRLVGGFGGALEMASLLATALLLPCFVAALHGRFSWPAGLALLLCLAALAATPYQNGPSHIGFYNRWCGSALAALFLFAVPPRRPVNVHVEGIAVAALLLFLFFVKASYFAVGLAFVAGFGVALGLFRRAAAVGVGVCAAVVVGVQIATGLVDDYLVELAHSLEVSGVAWYARDKYLRQYLPQSAPYYGALAAACFLAVIGKANIGWRRWAFLLFAPASCLVLQGHDASFFGPSPLVATLALLGERSVKASRYGVFGLLALFMLPYCAITARAVAEYQDDERARFRPAELPRMANVYMEDLAHDARPKRHCLYFAADESRAGLALLATHDVDDGVLALDYYNHYPALLDVPPLLGRLSVLMPGRTVSRDAAPSPEVVFGQAGYVLVPKTPNEERQVLLALYGEYLRRHYQLLGGNDQWQLWQRKLQAKPRTGSWQSGALETKALRQCCGNLVAAR